MGDWSFLATGHGLENVRHSGDRVATRVFFSVRDLDWGTPRVHLDYSGGRATDDALLLAGFVDEAPLELTGKVAVVDDSLLVSFRVTARADVEVSRAGPCILHERADLAPSFETDAGPVELADRITIERVASGYQRLGLEIDGGHVTIDFTGDRFELEDQRNWADSTFKSYCPPLSDPQPISLHAGDVRAYSISFRVSSSSTGEAVPTDRPKQAEAPARLVDEPESHRMPRLGLRHRGGQRNGAAVERLRALRPDYLHLFVDLASTTWRADLANDLELVERVGTDAVVSVDAKAVDATADDDASLVELAQILRAHAGTVLLFERGLPTTSAALAATPAFIASGITVGGGTRANFASLNAVGSVPDPLEIVAVPLAVASHDDDRRALTSSTRSFRAIVDDTRRIAGNRELLIGPVTFRPTFDSWPPAGTVRDPRADWRSTSDRDGTAFAAAWTVAAVAALAVCDVERVTIGSTDDIDTPVFEALLALGELRGKKVIRVRAGDRVDGLRASDSEPDALLVLGIMTDDTATLENVGRVRRLASPRVFVDRTRPETAAS